MVMMLQCGISNLGFAGLLGVLMAQGAASTESKFLSLKQITKGEIAMMLQCGVAKQGFAGLLGVRWHKALLLLKANSYPLTALGSRGFAHKPWSVPEFRIPQRRSSGRIRQLKTTQMIKKVKDILINTGLVLISISISIPLIAMEVYLRITDTTPFHAHALNSFHVADPDVGWRGRPDFKGIYKTSSFETLIEYGPDGYRKAQCETTPAEDAKTIAIMGDSFTRDLHWTPIGHELAARMVAPHLIGRKNGSAR